jgi:hypothetical protein
VRAMKAGTTNPFPEAAVSATDGASPRPDVRHR